MKSLEDLVRRLYAIADKNGDEFECFVDIRMDRSRSITYVFECQEKDDYHTFVNGVGSSIEEAVSVAESAISDALELWDYNE